MRILTFGVAVVVVGFFVARPYLDHRPLSLEEQAAIVGGEKGHVCQNTSGGICDGTDTQCEDPQANGGCEGKMEGDICNKTWREFENPPRCGRVTNQSLCCDDQGGGEEPEQDKCVIEHKCKCFFSAAFLEMLCIDPSEDIKDQSMVFKCVDGPCPEEG